MKKLTAVLLAVLMLFSAVSVIAFAEDEPTTPPEEDVYYTIRFVDYDGSEIQTLYVKKGDIVPAPANPKRENTDEYEYTFEGWQATNGTIVFKPGTIPVAMDHVTYMAVYKESEHIEVLTFWAFIQSIFARINQIFEYFHDLFTRNLD